MRRARALLACLFCLPLGATALIVLATPPASQALPPPAADVVRDLAAPLFQLVGMLPPDSLAGRLFYGSYEPLVPLFGSGALAAHALLLSLPFAALVLGFFLPRRHASA